MPEIATKAKSATPASPINPVTLPTPAPRLALSFTSGALLAREAAIAAPVYLEERDWARVRVRLADSNLLQTRTVASGKRVGREVVAAAKDSTMTKLRSNVFRMLIEAGLMTAKGDIPPAALSTRVAAALQARTPSEIRFFPTGGAR